MSDISVIKPTAYPLTSGAPARKKSRARINNVFSGTIQEYEGSDPPGLDPYDEEMKNNDDATMKEICSEIINVPSIDGQHHNDPPNETWRSPRRYSPKQPPCPPPSNHPPSNNTSPPPPLTNPNTLQNKLLFPPLLLPSPSTSSSSPIFPTQNSNSVKFIHTLNNPHRTFNVACWNVCSIQRVLKFHEFHDIIKDWDIAVLTETRSSLSNFHLDGYQCFNFAHINLNGKSTTSSGGIAIIYKNDFEYTFIRIHEIGPSMYAAEFDGCKLGFDKNILIVGVYIPHSESSFYNEDVWITLQNFLETHTNYHLILAGDFNARIGSLVPTLSLASECDLSTKNILEVNRSSEDKRVNCQGKDFIAMCSNTNFIILNGLRSIGNQSFSTDNFHNSPTFCPPFQSRSSVCDYICVPFGSLLIVNNFQVLDHFGLSDHNPVICRLNTNLNNANSLNNYTDVIDPNVLVYKSMYPKKKEYTNIEDIDDILCNNSDFINNFHHLTSIMGDIKLYNSLTTSSLHSSFDLCIKSLSESIKCIFPDDKLETIRKDIDSNADKDINKHKKNNKNKNKAHKNDWFDDELKAMKKHIKKLSKNKHLSLENRINYTNVRSKYYHLCRKKRRACLRNKMDKIENICTNDKSLLWPALDKILGFEKKTTLPIETSKLVNYFSDIFCKQNVKNDLSHSEDTLFNDQLSEPVHEYITYDDLFSLLDDIKCGKASGWDGMSSTLLHSLRNSKLFMLFLYTLFNIFIHFGYWPPEWNELIIVPILKNGKDPLEASSYRPIHLICVMAKLLAKIVESKLTQIVPRSPEQMGFNNSHGLRDNVLILSSIFEKYKKKGVFCAFIDFKGAFDSVDRSLLLSKLKQKDIDKNVLGLILSMYSNMKASI